MLIGNCTYSVRNYIREGKLDALGFARFNADLGIKALEYNDAFMESFEDSYLDKVRASAEKVGATISCLTCGGNFCSDNSDERKAQVATIGERLRNARRLGAPVIRANLGKMGDEEKDKTVGVERVVEAFNALLPVAKECDVKITIENHGGVSRWANEVVRIIVNTDPDWVGACPDFGNFPLDVRYRELGKVFPYSYHVHAKTHVFDENGEETETDFSRVMRMLKDIDYTDVVSIEFEGPEDQIEGVKKTKALIERYL